ncbi:MAG: exosome complex exonuclease Rrp41 [archaeon]|nr:exosome complex exonuclease Rrp41 [archaeon]
MSKKSSDSVEYVNSKGNRLDGRKVDELRPIKIQVGVIPEANGSAFIEWGQNKVFAAVYGPKECLPKHLANPYKAVLRCNYRMASFSVPDRKNPKPGRREIEISKVCAEALSRAVFLEKFPGTLIGVEIEVIDSNAGTRVAGLTAASVALADAGLPMRDLVCATSVGKAGGKIMVDLTKEEEDAPDAVDIPIGVLPSTGEVVLLQLDGLISKKEFNEALKLGFAAVSKVHGLQVEAIKKKYVLEENGSEEN